MRNETLTELKTKRYNYMERAQVEKGIKFIHTLVNKGVPLGSIDVNSWEDSISAIYVTIPYGRPGGGLYRKYYRWSEWDVKMAVKFYKSKSPKGGTNK